MFDEMKYQNITFAFLLKFLFQEHTTVFVHTRTPVCPFQGQRQTFLGKTATYPEAYAIALQPGWGLP